MLLGAVIPTKRSSEQPFLLGGKAQSFTVGDFWASAFSDLLTNMNRGILAEFLVLNALGFTSQVMNDIDEVDATLPSGVKLEVKSSAYLQRWKQSKPSVIRFSIEKKRRFDYELNDWVPESPRRHSDIYCFALYRATDKTSADPVNLDDWCFYCVPTSEIDKHKPDGKTIGLSELIRVFAPTECGYRNLADEVRRLESVIFSERCR